MSSRMRVTSSKARSRRGHHKAANPRVVTDKESGALHLKHHATPDGMYRGRQVVDANKRALRKEKQVAKLQEEVKSQEEAVTEEGEAKELDAADLSKK